MTEVEQQNQELKLEDVNNNANLRDIVTEINQLNDDDTGNNQLEIQGLLTTEFVSKLTTGQARQMNEFMNKVETEELKNDESWKELRAILVPLVREVKGNLDVVSGEADGDFFEKSDDFNNQIKGVVQNISYQIKKLEEIGGVDLSEFSGEFKDKAKIILDGLNKIQIILDKPNLENTQKLQKFIYENFPDDVPEGVLTKQQFLEANFRKGKFNNRDGKFGKSTLEGLNVFLKKSDSYIQSLEESMKVQAVNDGRQTEQIKQGVHEFDIGNPGQVISDDVYESARRRSEVLLGDIQQLSKSEEMKEQERLAFEKGIDKVLGNDFYMAGNPDVKRLIDDISSMESVTDVSRLQDKKSKLELKLQNAQNEIKILESILNNANNKNNEKINNDYKKLVKDKEYFEGEIKNIQDQIDGKMSWMQVVQGDLNELRKIYRDELNELLEQRTAVKSDFEGKKINIPDGATGRFVDKYKKRNAKLDKKENRRLGKIQEKIENIREFWCVDENFDDQTDKSNDFKKYRQYVESKIKNQ